MSLVAQFDTQNLGISTSQHGLALALNNTYRYARKKQLVELIFLTESRGTGGKMVLKARHGVACMNKLS
jgi:hypothetical protein